VISAYRPCHNLQDEFSTYKQHLRLLPSGSPEPRLAFVQDLQRQLSLWKDGGDLLIVMLDTNEEVCVGPVHDMFSSLELLNVMYAKAFPLFPQQVLSTGPGHLPIDAIFVSSSLRGLLVHRSFLPLA